MKLSQIEIDNLLKALKVRFEQNIDRHETLKWGDLQERLLASPEKMWSLNQMELSGGEPDVTDYDEKSDTYVFFDCSVESPKERRSVCYDREALESRKKYKPKTSAMDMSEEMGIEILSKNQYKQLQQLGNFDTKTSSWLKTPSEIRELGGAIFGDFRYGKEFIYHNGAESYYAARGFRGFLKV